MPSIKEAIQRNTALQNAATSVSGDTASSNPSTTLQSPQQDLAVQAPQRGMFPANLVLASDRSDSSRTFRGLGMRSATFPFSTPQTTQKTIVQAVAASSAAATATGILLLTNSIENPVQDVLNLVEGTNITLVTDDTGQVVISATGGGVGSEGSLTVPSIFSVSGALPITSTGGPVIVTLNGELTSTFLAAPPVNAPSSLDGITINSGGGSTSVSDSVSASNANDFALYCLSPGNYAIDDGPGSPWTLVEKIQTNDLWLYSNTFSAAGTQDASWTLSSSSAIWASAAVIFKSAGSPSVRQTKSIETAAGAGTYTATFSENVNAGSVILVVCGSGNSSSAVFAYGVSDSANGTYSPLVSSRNTQSSQVAQLQFFAVVNPTSDSPTVSVTVSGPSAFYTNGICMFEITGLSAGEGVPYFRQIYASDLANAVFGPAGTNHSAGAVPDPGSSSNSTKFLRDDASWDNIDLTADVINALPIANGGTGTSSPSLVAGTDIAISGSWPNQTIATTVDAKVALTAQTSSISATNLIVSPSTTALYQISYYLNVTTVGTAGTVTVTFTWNDGASQTVTSSSVSLITLGGYASGVLPIRATSGAIQYSTTVTGATGSPQYALDIRVRNLT